MIVAIAQAYNGIHKDYARHLKKMGVKFFYFNIDKLEWFKVEAKKPDAYIWLADNKEERYREIYDRIYFIQYILNKPVFPDMAMYFAEGDKVKQWQILSHLQAPLPKTFIATQKEQTLKLIKKIKYPFVLKDPYGYGGYHVFKIKNIAQAKKYADKIFSPRGLVTKYSTCRNIFYAQEFMPADRDLRVITIGGKVVSAYWRIGQSGEWKHNLDQGAQVSFNDIPAQPLKLCEEISRKLNFHWTGFDLLQDSKHQFKIIEFSANVRVKGALKGGVDIRKMQAEYIYKFLKTSRYKHQKITKHR